ncbi:hypothetical protein [Myroides guanonis]|uniref:Outer membrane protein beta-barrel domain-containing protein n=1 Tax=Myroides guanonis TaxID=1150112 RepID=A0A1I3Q2S1_9FLAO|nr:hypothetical protein [Myroides guanonis]SFJ27995.1 hypothetical protein SAMN04487893_10526 [Myroides guanonis]
MKKQLILGITLLATGLFSVQAQDNSSEFLANTTFELGWGYNIPMSPTDGIKAGDFSGVNSLYVGAHYQLDDFWGLRGTYAYNGFKDKDNSDFGLTFHKFMLESTFNISKAISGVSTQTPFEVLSHTGLGISVGKSELKSGSDNIGNVQIGLMPRYNITDKISVHLDATYVINFSQNYGYNGGPAVENGDSATGGYFTANLGVALKL